MAATKRRFTVPSAEDLHGEIQVSRPKPLFNTYKKYCKCIEEKKDDTSTCTTNVNDRKGDEKNDLAARTLHEQSQEDQRIVEVTLDPNQDSLSKESNLEPSENNHTSAAITSAGAGSVKPTVGKTFRETFAFLEDTSHFKETVAKIKEKESTIDVKGPPVSSRSKSNAIIVNPRQKGNPVLKHVRNVPWEMGDIIPDYVLGPTTCALFLSLRYHHFNPEYVHERLRQLGQRYQLRILLVQVDVKDPHQTLKELAKMAMMADCTLMLAWSPEEAGRYLETYKVYENKPPDALLGQSEGDYLSKLTDCLTTVKGINKTDVVSLSSTFESLANMATASKDNLALLPGFGPLKAQRLHDLIQLPFVAKKSKETEDDKTV
ncbi:DNA excision repair protein ERCC-1-like isoform X1 [Orbicella faveolata]|uniref:DNA excision repair protein ERCC-1-like isoform X1 n=1 Tax=Orbicella faveolata TaxID=48498 RepID=UPI0009E396C8|nr:DNA excision repair protein ERCC-1-like isoform X1 [Orbicella faveolata]